MNRRYESKVYIPLAHFFYLCLLSWYRIVNMESDLMKEMGQLLAVEEDKDSWDNVFKRAQHHQIKSVSALFDLVGRFAASFGKQHLAAQWVADVEERLDIITHKLKFIDRTQRPQVMVLDSLSPYSFVENDYLNDLIHLAGGTAWSDSHGFDPGVLIILAEDKPMFSYLGDLPGILGLTEWKDSGAVKNNKIYLVEERHNLTMPSIQVAEQVELLAQMLFPQYFFYEDAGDTWMPFDLSNG